MSETGLSDPSAGPAAGGAAGSAAQLHRPTAEDPLARLGSEVLGGPAGRRIGTPLPGWAAPLPIALLVTTVLVAVGAAGKHHCRTDGWSTPDQFFHACYADGPVVYASSGLAAGGGPWGGGVSLGQPPLTALLSWFVGRFVPSGTGLEAQRGYFDVSAVVLLLCALGVVLGLSVLVGRRGWDALLLAASPLLALSALISFQLLGVALGVAALALWARRRPWAAGVVLGLAVAASTLALVLLPALGVLALRAGRLRVFARTAAATATVLLLVAAGLSLSVGAAWADYLRESWGQRAGYGSVWLLPQLLQQATSGDPASAGGLPGPAVTVLAIVSGLVWILAVALLVLWAPRRPRVPQVAFLLVAGMCLTGPAFTVQTSLWLLPLAAAALPSWRDHVLWWVAEAGYFVSVWLYIAGLSTPERGLPAEFYAVALVVRLLAVGWLVVLVVRDVRAPRVDVVRAQGFVDDPAGGPLDRAPDRLVVRIA